MTPRHKVVPVRHTDHVHSFFKKRSIIALNIALLLVLVGGTTAYGVLGKTVTLSVDGRTDTVRTFSGSVPDVLASNGVNLRPGDQVGATTSSITDGDKIKVKYAKPVTVAVDGKSTHATVHDSTVGDILDRYEVQPQDEAFVSVSRSARIPRDGMKIVVSNPKQLTVKADGDTTKLTSSAPTVAEVLEEAGVKLDKDDEVSPARFALVGDAEKVKVTRIEMIDKTETVKTGPPVEYKDDPELEKGTTEVLKAGKPGKARENVLITKADGQVRHRLVLTSKVIDKPVKRVVSRGTAEAPSVASNSVWDKIAQCESGGNWSINTGNGYYGGLQFSAATWRSVGGPGLPHQHSRETQIKYAKILQKRSGWGQWGCAHARFN